MRTNRTTQVSLLARHGTFVTLVLPGAMLWPTAAFPQKGMGDSAGLARQLAKPDLIRLSGVLEKTDTHPCELSTGRAVLGTHLIVKNDQGQQLNIHLGPAAAVEDISDQLRVGMKIEIIGFRTKKMPTDQYVAKSLIMGEKVIQLRDAGLRPYWAGTRLRGQGPARTDDWAMGPRGRGWMRPYSDRWPGRGWRPYRGNGYGRCGRGRFRGCCPRWGWSGGNRGLRRGSCW